jgi:hypothetical protein
MKGGDSIGIYPIYYHQLMNSYSSQRLTVEEDCKIAICFRPECIRYIIYIDSSSLGLKVLPWRSIVDSIIPQFCQYITLIVRVDGSIGAAVQASASVTTSHWIEKGLLRSSHCVLTKRELFSVKLRRCNAGSTVRTERVVYCIVQSREVATSLRIGQVQVEAAKMSLFRKVVVNVRIVVD